jgi:hypothetical protein
LFDGFGLARAGTPQKVNGPVAVGTIFREPWNQIPPTVLRQFGLGSMSLILLHHLLFHHDL